MRSSFSPDTRALLVVTLSLIAHKVHAACYWQNSPLAPDAPESIAQDDTACFPDQENSPCCGTGWTCLSDGVCMINQSGNDFYYRGTCTDRFWNSQQCPGWCFAQNSNTSIPLAKCDSEQDWYCCPGDAECSCETGKNAVKLGAEQPTTVTVIGSTTWPGYTPTTAGFTEQPLNTDGTASDDSATSTPATATDESSPSSSSESGTTPAAAGADSSSSSTAQPQSGSSNSGGDTALAAGLGAGLGVAAALLIGGAAWFFIRRRRSRQRDTAMGRAAHGEAKPMVGGSSSSHVGGAAAGLYPDDVDPKGPGQQRPVEMGVGEQGFGGRRAEMDGTAGGGRRGPAAEMEG